MCVKCKGVIFNLSGKPQNLVIQYIKVGSNISSTESVIKTHLAKVWNAVDELLGRFDKIKQDIVQAVAVSLLIYGCTRRMVTKNIE